MNVCPRPRTVAVRAESYDVPCGSRYCPVCGLRWQGDQRVRAVAASEHIGPASALITVTGPGGNYFARAAGRTSGSSYMHVRRWNASARRRWRAMHLYASRPLRGWAREHAPGWRLSFRSWEFQKRGVLHLHLVLPYGTPEERRVTDLYLWNLWSCARQFGFGYVMGGDKGKRPTWGRPPKVKVADGPAAARYVCKYVAATGAGKEGMVDVAKRTATRGSILYVAPALTRASGCSMTTLRARRRIWARHAGSDGEVKDWDAVCLVDAVQRRRPPLTEEGIATIREAACATGATHWVDARTGEVGEATDAPKPRENGRTEPRGVREEVRLVLHLAPVLLPDPDRPQLGPLRTAVRVVP